MMNLKKIIHKINHSKDAKVFFAALFCYILALLMNPISPIVSPSEYLDINNNTTINLGAFLVLICSAVYYSYLLVKKLITGQDTTKSIKFKGIINNESELNESVMEKDLKKALMPVILILLAIIILPIIFTLIFYYFKFY